MEERKLRFDFCQFELGVLYAKFQNIFNRRVLLRETTALEDTNGYDELTWNDWHENILNQENARLKYHCWKNNPLKTRALASSGLPILR